MRNREYLVLLKFLNGDNYKGFYKALDTLIKESIDCFDTLDICDKAYIYIAYYLFQPTLVPSTCFFKYRKYIIRF